MTDIAPNYRDSLDFLRKWSPEGWWIITAIHPDTKKIDTGTFSNEKPDLLLDFLKVYGAERNIYFHVNPTTRPMSKKALREDMARMEWLHVDIDPRAGEDITEERARALRLLQNPPAGVAGPPTVIIDSGGGYQGFWRLEDPVEIAGVVERAEEAKLYNLQVEIIYGADNCHNIDRIMRLPGTINRPDERKRKKGRVEALASVVEFDETRIYEVSQWTKAPMVQAPDEGAFGNDTRLVNLSGNIRRLGSVDELDEIVTDREVSDLLKGVIVQGNDPNDETRFIKKDGSFDRSNAVFFVCCELIRLKVHDDIIFSIITDPDFGVSESVLEKGRDAPAFAKRQMHRAHEKAINPELAKMNGRHAVIENYGGRCLVVEEIYDESVDRHRLTKQSFDHFKNRYMNRRVKVGENEGQAVYMPAGAWWLGNENRRQYRTIVFAPGKEIADAYNLWRGFAVPAIPGDGHEPYLEHLLTNICAGNEEHFNYLVRWMANSVQNPSRPGQTAVVMRGDQGAGKGVAIGQFGHLFGRHFLQVTDSKHLVGNFNSHLRDCVVLFGDEAFYAGDKKHEATLKTLITEDRIVVESKGVDAETSANCVHLMMASNDAWVVPADLKDRRFFVLDVDGKRVKDRAYFRDLIHTMREGGSSNLLHHLLTMDLSEFDVRDMPKTAALQRQKQLSMKPEEQWWFEKLREGRILDTDDGWTGEVIKNDLWEDWAAHCRQFNIARRSNPTALGHFLARVIPGEEFPKSEQRRTPIEVDMGGGKTKTIKKPYWYVLPSLEDCRARWDEVGGGPYKWTDPKEIINDGYDPDSNDDHPF